MTIAELANQPTRPATKEHKYPDDLLRALGSDSWFTRNELDYLFGREFSCWLANMEASKKIHPTGIKLFDERHPQWRYSLSQICQHIRDAETPIRYDETPIGLAVLDGEPSEAIDSERTYTVTEISQHFGVAEDKLDRGKLAGYSHPFKPFAVRGERLITWIESDNIKTRWSVDTASRIVRLRRAAGEQQLERKQAAKQKPTLLDTAFDAIEQAEKAEQAEMAANRAKALTSYRAVLARRSKPKQDDPSTLAELCRELGYDREHVDGDIRALDKVSEAERHAATVDECYTVMQAASEDLAELQKRCKAELVAADDRQQRARSALRRAQGAPGEIAETKRKHAELFG